MSKYYSWPINYECVSYKDIHPIDVKISILYLLTDIFIRRIIGHCWFKHTQKQLPEVFCEETPIQVFFCEIYVTFRNTYLVEHLQTTASADPSVSLKPPQIK